MNEVTRRLGILIEEASPLVMMPLLLVCFLLWALLLERASFYGETPWGFLVDGHGRKIRGRLRIWRSFHAWMKEPSSETRDAFIHELDAHPSPLSLFLRRFTRDNAPLSPRLRELRLAEAAGEGSREIRRGLGVLHSLSRAALLLAVLGAVEGASRTLRDWTLAGCDPAAWSTGAVTALLAPQAAAFVAALGILSTGWLVKRAKELEDEILLGRAHLGSPDGRPSWRSDR